MRELPLSLLCADEDVKEREAETGIPKTKKGQARTPQRTGKLTGEGGPACVDLPYLCEAAASPLSTTGCLRSIPLSSCSWRYSKRLLLVCWLALRLHAVCRVK